MKKPPQSKAHGVGIRQPRKAKASGRSATMSAAGNAARPCSGISIPTARSGKAGRAAMQTGIRVRVSDGELLRKITLLMNRVIANADLMLPHPKVKPRDSAVVLNLQQQISDEMEQERPSEERIVGLLCEIASQLYKETNAKMQITAQIARKRVSLMKPQDAFNAAYFSELIDTVSLHMGGGVVLHTKTETDICESEEEPNGSPENSETDSFRN